MSDNSDLNSVQGLLTLPVSSIIDLNVGLLESDKTVSEAIALMKSKGLRSVLALHNGEVVGIVTKTDVLFKIMSQAKNPSKIKLREVMTSPVYAIEPKSTIQEALSMMDKHVVRQIIVSSGSSVLGMVSRENIFEKIHLTTMKAEDAAFVGTPVCIINPKSIAYTKDTLAAKLSCPYCGSPFDTKEGLSLHIDRLHVGAGVLEGDVRHMLE
jgi:CBS domain-containing protein